MTALAARVRVNRPAPKLDPRAIGVVALGAAAGLALAGWERSRDRQPSLGERVVGLLPEMDDVSGPARLLRASAALLAGSVLADSATEHYRGSYKNPAMYLPLISASLAILAAGQGSVSGGGVITRRFRDSAYGLAGALGLGGVGFHLFNVGKRPGGYNWLNLFYAAPLGAPAALSLTGLIGYAAERLSSPGGSSGKRLFALPFGRALAGVTGVGIMGTVSEALLLHFRGAFQNPFMWLPVSLPPVASALVVKAALTSSSDRHWLTRGWLWLTAALGIGGVGFHAYGVSRAMGGWRNWSQNVIDGPPLPAPPSFSALALAGLAALDLIEGRGRRS